jgi:ribosome-associated toxin RatA of RatAB toxin-antitoxin module
MMRVKKQLHVPYTVAEMYNLVNDIEHYPLFLPGCKTASIQARSDQELTATIGIAKKGIEYTFTTVNRLETNRRIEMRLAAGPLKQLEGVWQFNALSEGGGCVIDIDLSFSFKSKLIALTVSPFVSLMTESIMEAFLARAQYLYAKA